MELTIYQQTKNNVIKLYCSDCKPQDTSRRSTLVIIGGDHFCDGCGLDFKDIALVAFNEARAREDYETAEFYNLMAEAQ